MATSSTTIPVTCDPENRLARVAPADLQRFQGGLKTLSRPEYAKLRDSILKYGFFVPVFVWQGQILDGHQRLFVVEKEGWQIEGGVPVVEIQAKDKAEAAEKLLVISSTYGKVDPQGLYEFTEAHDIPLTDFEIPDLPDFNVDKYLAEFYKDEHPGDPDEVPEVPDDPVSQRGDLYVLGDHRLLCGDSTDAAAVAGLLAGGAVDMVLTDPPYGVSYVGKTKDALTIENDGLAEEDLAPLIAQVFDNAWNSCRPGAYWYATVPPGPSCVVFVNDWHGRGALRQILTWVKDSMVLGHSEYHYRHEFILFGWVPGERHKNKDRTRTSVWECERPKASREHPTMKPVELWERAVVDGSRPGETIYDPFVGSGTTIIAAENQGRKCYAMELDPEYVDVCVQRWEQYTGRKAERLTSEVAPDTEVA